MTATETAGVTTLIRVVDMTKATKVAHGSLFWGEDTAQRDGKNHTPAPTTRPRNNNGLP